MNKFHLIINRFLYFSLLPIILSYNFQLSCNLHDISESIGYYTPKQAIPLHINEKINDHQNKSWLNIDLNDIETWYIKGKKECNNALNTMQSNFQGEHARFQSKSDGKYQKKCRGKKSLYDFSGMIVWTFGPINICPTYSKCWFGLLSCGTPKNEQISDYLHEILPREFNKMKLHSINNTFSDSITIPKRINWSIKALNMLIRVVGSEIVVPEQRYMELFDKATNKLDDIIIAQYHLTKPMNRQITQEASQISTLEIRLFELYPSLFLNWEDKLILDYKVHNLGSIYLGGNEIRCAPGSIGKCPIENICCGCDEESFILNTPIKVNVLDHSKLCNQSLLIENIKSLPLCRYKDSSSPGRWIAAGMKSSDHKLRCKQPQQSPHQSQPQLWYEISGDPCSIQSLTPEDFHENAWFYAPYSCKYHSYTKSEALQCLLDQNLTHIHIAGDSMTRDFLAQLTSFLGIPGIDANHLKKMTNDMKINHLKFQKENLIISESYFWSYSIKAMKYIEMLPLPDIYITNYAFAHQYANNPVFEYNFIQNDYNYWKNIYSINQTKPKYLIYQNAKELQGRRNLYWTSNIFRSNSDYLRKQYKNLGFIELNEYLLTVGRYPFTYKPTADGWHFHGNVRNMEVILFFNMICNMHKFYLHE